MNAQQAAQSPSQWLVLGTVFLLGAWIVQAQAQTSTTPIGTVTVLLGQAHVEREGKLQPMSKGMDVYPDDKISTLAQALVQLKMQDNALLSLRESTQLHIHCYQENCMKLELLAGQMRQVTGKMGQENKQSYRLNTPVAAIGVRGTDFITKASKEDTWVSVLEGAIVASPFGDGCQMQDLGVCNGKFATDLSAQEKAMLNIKAGVAPVLMLENGPLQTSSLDTSADKRQAMVDQQLTSTDAAIILKDHPQLLQLTQQLTQQLPPTTPTEKQSQLLYTTWINQADGVAQAADTVTSNYEATVGDARHVLWRDASTPQQTLTGKIDYSLTQSQASITSASGSINAVNVTQGQLAIDFDRQQLTTELNLQGQGLNNMVITSKGTLTRNDGLFSQSTQQGGKIAGAISNDGQQVGYMLNQPLTGEVLKALTLWQAQ